MAGLEFHKQRDERVIKQLQARIRAPLRPPRTRESPGALGVAGLRVRVHELRERDELEHAPAEELGGRCGFEVAHLPRQKEKTLRRSHEGNCGMHMGRNIGRARIICKRDRSPSVRVDSRHDEVSRRHTNLPSEKGVEET